MINPGPQEHTRLRLGRRHPKPTRPSFCITHPDDVDAQALSNAHSGALDRTDLAVAAGLAFVSAIVIFPGLGLQSLANWDEAIYGVVTREVLARPGLTLYYGGTPWFEKPPLFFWLAAASTLIFGLSESALRLPAAILGIGAVVLQYLAGRRLGGRSTALMAAILLLGVPQFIAYSRLAMTDVPLIFWGMLCIVLLMYAKGPAMNVAAGAAFGLAILTKSAAAFLFVPGFVAYVVALRSLRALWSREFFFAIVGAVTIALPWHIWSVVTYGRLFVNQYLLFHVVARFVRPLEGHVGDPFVYFVLYAYNGGWLALLHLTGIALASVLAVLKRDRSLGAAVVLALGSFVIVNAQETKIGWYLTPVYPGMALAAALGITRFLSRSVWRFAALLLALALAMPGTIHGRGVFVEEYNILDYSPEVRALRKLPPFTVGRVPLLYTLDVSEPAVRFYLADEVKSVDRLELGRLLAEKRPFLCLAFKAAAVEFFNKHRHAKLNIIASNESLAIIQHGVDVGNEH